MAKRPPTIREIRRAKEPPVKHTVTIMNCCKQVITIQCKPPKGVDFFIGEAAIRVYPNKTTEFDKNRVRMAQLRNLQKQRKIRIVSDSEKIQKGRKSK